LGQRVTGSSLAVPARTTCLGMEVGSSTASCDSRQLGQLSSCSGASASLSSSLTNSKESACDINDLRLMLSASLAAQEEQRILQQKSQEQLAECMAVLCASRQELCTVRREVEVLRQAHFLREHHEGSLGVAHERSGGSRQLLHACGRSSGGLGSSDERWRSETPPRKTDHNVAGVAAVRESSPAPSSAVTASPPGCTTMTPKSAPRGIGQVMTPSSHHSSILRQNLIWCPGSGGVWQEQQQQQQIGLAVPPMPTPLRSD